MFLTADAVVRLTGRKRHKAQRRVLDGLGIRYIVAGTGEPLVREAALDERPKDARNRAPRWDRLHAPASS